MRVSVEELVDRLRETVQDVDPRAEGILDDLEELHQAIIACEFPEFFEPVQLNNLGEDRLEHIDADTVASWCLHAGFGSMVKMANLENSVLKLLSAGDVYSSMVLIRSHMEQAGLPVYTLHKLHEADERDDWNNMDYLISKTFYGTSLGLNNKLDIFDGVREPTARRHLESGKFVGALNDFHSTVHGEETEHCRAVYKLLCDYVHPTMRTMSTFSEVTEETSEGWFIQYGFESAEGPEMILNALGILLLNMRLGYAASYMLLKSSIEEEEGDLRYVYPDPEDVAYAWTEILQQDPPEDPSHSAVA